jgi:hypothetical protein
LSIYKYCRLVNIDNDDGIDPVRLFVDSLSVTNLDGPLIVLGIDPRRLFALTSSNVNDVKRPIDVGRLPARPAPDRPTDTTTPPAHVTLFHDDVDGPVHTFTVTGIPPLHCQLLYAARLLAPVAADISHIILSWYTTIDGELVGRADGDTDGDCDGVLLGSVEGEDVEGELEGADDGVVDGDAEGSCVGAVVGDVTGLLDGCDDGMRVGDTLGPDEGVADGPIDGDNVGPKDGDALGKTDGSEDGCDDGTTLGDTDGDDEGALVHATNPDPKFFVALGVKHDA